MQPLANSYIPLESANRPEPRFPLYARVCDHCLLVQVDIVKRPDEIFVDYAYFSSFSESWLAHCRAYVDSTTKRFNLGPNSRVVEIASNDGYMLQYFVAKGIPVLGIEPAANVAKTAVQRGVPTEVAFFGTETARRLAKQGWQADLLAAKNVLAHVPDINDFVAGIPILLKPSGIFTVEFPHLLNLLREVQFDTIYHEHFTYLSLLAVRTIFDRHGLTIFDVEKQPTHGGSLRLFAARADAGRVPESGSRRRCARRFPPVSTDRKAMPDSRPGSAPSATDCSPSSRRPARKARQSLPMARPRRAIRCSTTVALPKRISHSQWTRTLPSKTVCCLAVASPCTQSSG